MHSRLRITGFLLVLSLAALPLSSAQQVCVKVVFITDGDTINVLMGDKAERVRLYGIDAQGFRKGTTTVGARLKENIYDSSKRHRPYSGRRKTQTHRKHAHRAKCHYREPTP